MTYPKKVRVLPTVPYGLEPAGFRPGAVFTAIGQNFTGSDYILDEGFGAFGSWDKRRFEDVKPDGKPPAVAPPTPGEQAALDEYLAALRLRKAELAAGRMNPTIMTSTGLYFNFENPDPYSIQIEDIAHALSNLCRYTGHTREFYSVAQHSVLVSRHVPPRMALVGLLHDATEAYVGDMSRPLKLLNPAYKVIEDRVWGAICQRFGLPLEMPPEIKHADNVMLMTERRDLMPPHNSGADEWHWAKGIPVLPNTIQGLPPYAAKERFLKRFEELLAQPEIQEDSSRFEFKRDH